MIRHGWLALAIVVGISLARNAAADAPKLDVIVRVTSSAERELLTRILGQVADLDVTLTTDDTPLEATLPAQLTSADVLAAGHHARVVVWFLPRNEGAGLLLCISEPAAGRVLVRAVQQSELGPLTSAALEEAALVVRNALRALAAGGTIGVERTVYAPTKPKPVATPAPPPPKHGGDLAAFGGLGAQIGTDGVAGNANTALWLGVRSRVFELRLDGSMGAPTDTVSPYATFHIARDVLAIAASIDVGRSASWDLDVGVRAGAIAYVRTTRDPSPSVVAAPLGVSGAGLAGLEVRWRWRPTRAAWGIVALVGVDAVLGAPTFELATPTGFIHVFTPSVAQPRALLGFELEAKVF